VSRPAVQVLAWAVYLTVLTVILWIWWPHWLSVAELGGAAVVTALIAVVFTLAHRGGQLGDTPYEARELRSLPDLSVGPAIVAIALCGMLYGAEFGLFLVLICGGLLALGLVELAAELRTERERRRREM
jgi:hypothetical protein